MSPLPSAAIGYATDHTAWLNELVSGLLLVVLCADAAGVRALMRARRKPGSGRTRGSTPAVAETAGSRS